MDLSYILDEQFANYAQFVNPMPAQGVKRPRKAAKPATPKPERVREPTVAEMREFAKAMGLKATTAHSKRELIAMITNNVYVRPAAYDKQNAKRKAERAIIAAAREAAQ